MSKPQQPELSRSGHTPVVEGEHAKEAVEVQGRPAAEGSTGPVPEDNRPGHHPDTEQDKPDVERYRSRMAGDDSEG